MAQLTEWFSLDHCSKSAAQFDFDKLKWLNNHYLRVRSGEDLAALIAPRMRAEGFVPGVGPALDQVCELLKDRAATLTDLAEEASVFYLEPQPDAAALADRLAGTVPAALKDLAASLPNDLDAPQASALIKTQLAAHGLKMPQLAMALRLVLLGRSETPSIDKVMAVLGREKIQSRIAALVR
jgi:glutamyl-tRNA synthetase